MVASSPSITRAEGLHAELKAVRKERRTLDYRAAMLLRQIDDEKHYQVFGHASIYQYAKAEHGLESRPTQDLLRIARRLEHLPVMTAAFAAGELDKTKVRELVAVATPSTESAWVDRAKSLPNRAVEALVAAVGPDGMPPDVIPEPPLKSSQTTMTIRLERADAEVLYAWLAWARQQHGIPAADLSDGALLALHAKSQLAAASADAEVSAPVTSEPYRIVIHHCEACGAIRANDAEISDTIVDEAQCDALITEMRPGDTQGHTAHEVPPAARTIALCNAGYRCQVPGCKHRLYLHLHHIRGRDIPNPHHPDNLAVVCDAHHRVTHAGHFGVERKRDGRLVFHSRRGVIPTWGHQGQGVAVGAVEGGQVVNDHPGREISANEGG